MNESHGTRTIASDEPNASALFSHLVLQQSNMAMMLLGKVARPDTGQVVQDLEGARLFIDQLEMLEAKTKGNLNKDESTLLKQSLMALRLAFVEAVEAPATPSANPQSPAAQPGSGKAQSSAAPLPNSTTTEEEHRVKFTKKY